MDFFPRAGLKGCASSGEAPARPALGQLPCASPRQELPAHTPVPPTELNAASSTATGFSISSRPARITPTAILSPFWVYSGFRGVRACPCRSLSRDSQKDRSRKKKKSPLPSIWRVWQHLFIFNGSPPPHFRPFPVVIVRTFNWIINLLLTFGIILIKTVPYMYY